MIYIFLNKRDSTMIRYNFGREGGMYGWTNKGIIVNKDNRNIRGNKSSRGNMKKAIKNRQNGWITYIGKNKP